MIEVLDSRELTDKELRKYELQREIERKQHELEELESLEEKGSEDVKDTKDVKDGVSSLTVEEERVVSEAIKKGNQKNALTEDELKEIKERSQREYESIASDVKSSTNRILCFLAIMIIIALASAIITRKSKQQNEIIDNTVENTEGIIVEVEVD